MMMMMSVSRTISGIGERMLQGNKRNRWSTMYLVVLPKGGQNKVENIAISRIDFKKVYGMVYGMVLQI